MILFLHSLNYSYDSYYIKEHFICITHKVNVKQGILDKYPVDSSFY
jgi:hypothetical protein